MQALATILLLICSNIFMTFAWYGHLRFKSTPLWEAIFASWLIAFLEYCFQVPANRIGSYVLSTAELKVIQEVITLSVFSIFSILYLKEQLRWNYLVAFVLIIGAVIFVFSGSGASAKKGVASNALPPSAPLDPASRVL
jgi:uncharacterized protein